MMVDNVLPHETGFRWMEEVADQEIASLKRMVQEVRRPPSKVSRRLPPDCRLERSDLGLKSPRKRRRMDDAE